MNRSLYNEIDPFCIEWLQNLIAAGEIPDGDIDDRSIAELRATDILGYRQFHTFCGIAGWPEALRLAEWPEEWEVWTGSCPCQPFSVSGRKRGTEDKRHLWPDFRNLIEDGRPAVVFGEQVASAMGREWLARVRADMERLGYVVGAADLCSPCEGGPHIRQLLYWGAVRMADTEHNGGTWRSPEQSRCSTSETGTGASVESGRCCDVGRLGNASCDDKRRSEQREQIDAEGIAAGGSGSISGLGDVFSERLERYARDVDRGNESRRIASAENGSIATSGAWSDSVLIRDIEGNYRRIGSKSFPLAYGVPRDMGRRKPELQCVLSGARSNRVGRLKAYGNAIVPQLAAAFVREFMASVHESGVLR